MEFCFLYYLLSLKKRDTFKNYKLNVVSLPSLYIFFWITYLVKLFIYVRLIIIDCNVLKFALLTDFQQPSIKNCILIKSGMEKTVAKYQTYFFMFLNVFLDLSRKKYFSSFKSLYWNVLL